MPLEMDTSWYVLYTKPRAEKKVEERLIKNGIEAYCPTFSTLKQWSDRKKKVDLPLIPSYLFVRIEEYNRSSVLQDPGVLNFVFWQGKPAKISQQEIQTLKTETAHLEIKEAQLGESIRIEQGIFKGLEGLIIEKNKTNTTIYLANLGMVLKIKKRTHE